MKKLSSVSVGNFNEKLVKSYFEGLGFKAFIPAKKRFQKDKDIFDVGDVLVMSPFQVWLVQVKTGRIPCKKERQKYIEYQELSGKVLPLELCIVHQEGALLEFLNPDLSGGRMVRL